MKTLIQRIEDNLIFKFVKENFSLIIFIPSLLGGLRQFVILLFHSPTLIQYFSFTQIAIDGLEIIFQVIFVIIFAILYYKLLLKRIKKNLKRKLLSILFLVIYAIILIYFDVFQDMETTYNLSTFKSYLLKVFSLIMLSVLLADSYDSIYNISNDISDKIYRSFFFYSDIIIAIYALYYIIAFKPFQYNVENVNYSTKEVRKKFKKKAELIYYNDTYLIYILNPDAEIDKRRFYVQKFETLFDEEKKEDK